MITLSTEQFDSLLRAALSTSHLWEACLVLLGVTCGWGFQALENKRRNNQTRTENLHNIIAQYNAAFAKFTTIATSVAINGNDLILKNFLKEKKQWEKLISKEAYAHDIIDFGALTTFPCLDERPLLEIMQPSLATLYSPFLNQVLQTLLNDTYRYNQILDFRNTMIKESEIHSTKTWDEKDIPNLLSKYEAIHDATLKVLFLAETLIDHTLWVQARLNKEIYEQYKSKIKEENLDTYIIGFEINKHHIGFLKEITSLIDTYPQFTGRLLMSRHAEMLENGARGQT